MNFPPLAIILILIIAALAVHFFHREYGELAKARITRSPDSTEARVDALKAVAERAQHHLAVVEKRLDAGGGVMECSRPRGSDQFEPGADHKMLWWPGHRPTDILGVCSPPSRRVATLRGALGLDDGSAHACPDRQLSDDAQRWCGAGESGARNVVSRCGKRGQPVRKTRSTGA